MPVFSLLMLLSLSAQVDSLLGAGEKDSALEAARAHYALVSVSTAFTGSADTELHPDSLAFAHDMLGRCYRTLAQHDSAETHYRRSLAIRRAHLAPNDPQIATTLNNVGLAIWFGRSRMEALPHFEEALQIYESTGADTSLDAVVCKTNLGNLYRLMDRTEEARDLFDEVLVFRRAYYDGPHVKLAAAIKNVARLERDLLHLERAFALYQEALAMEEQCGGAEYSGYASTLSDLAKVYSLQGEWLQAELLEFRSLELRRKRDPDSPRTMKSLLRLTSYASGRNDLGRMQDLIDELIALDERQRQQGQTRNIRASWEYLSGVLHSAARDEQIRRLEDFREVIESHPDRDQVLPFLLERLASLHARNGDPVVARVLREELEDFIVGLPESGLEWRSFLYREKAWMFLREGKLDSCATEVIRCVEMLDSLPGNVVERDRMNCDLLLATIAFEREDWFGAERLARKAVERQGKLRKTMAVGIDRSTISWGNPHSLLAASLVMQGRTEEGIETVEGYRGRSLIELLEIYAMDREGARVRSTLADLGRRMRNVENAIAAIGRSGDFRGEAAVDSLRILRDSLKAERSQAEIMATRTFGSRDASLSEMAAALPAGSALLGWIEIERSSRRQARWVYSLDSGGLARVTRLPDLPLHGTTAEALRKSLLARKTIRDSERAWFLENTLDSHLEQAASYDALYVVGSEALAGLPLSLLLPETPITTIPSGTALAFGPAEKPDARSVGRALLVASSQSEALDGSRTASDSTIADSVVFDIASDWDATRSHPGELRAGDLGPIPWADSEVDTIGSLLREARVLTGEEAREEVLLHEMADSMGSFRLLHFATHVLVDPTRPMRSAIVVSRTGLSDPVDAAKRGAPVFDGLVTAGEILDHWNLDGGLVVLSGCGSGLGRPVRGEGHVGLPAAFLQAGADHVLATAWPVNDRASTLFMSRFYRSYLEGPSAGDAARALVAAQEWMRNRTSSESADYSAPFYWAPYFLIGVRPLTIETPTSPFTNARSVK